MKVGMVAIHYPVVEHHARFVARVQQAADVIGSTPGCLSADCWSTSAGAVVSTAQWETTDAMRNSFRLAEAAGVDFSFDEREGRPREIHHLVSPAVGPAAP